MDWWSPDERVFPVHESTADRAHAGERSYQIEYDKTAAVEPRPWAYIGADPKESKTADLTRGRSLQMWVYGQVTLLVKLEDKSGKGIDLGIRDVVQSNDWTQLCFDLSVLGDQFDRSDVKILFFPEPGEKTGNGVFYVDDMVLGG